MTQLPKYMLVELVGNYFNSVHSSLHPWSVSHDHDDVFRNVILLDVLSVYKLDTNKALKNNLIMNFLTITILIIRPYVFFFFVRN